MLDWKHCGGSTICSVFHRSHPITNNGLVTFRTFQYVVHSPIACPQTMQGVVIVSPPFVSARRLSKINCLFVSSPRFLSGRAKTFLKARIGLGSLPQPMSRLNVRPVPISCERTAGDRPPFRVNGHRGRDVCDPTPLYPCLSCKRCSTSRASFPTLSSSGICFRSSRM